MDDDATDAAWGELQVEERHHREDAAMERHRKLLEEFRRTNAEYAVWERNWNRRMQQLRQERT
jgi:hypothetical protein